MGAVSNSVVVVEDDPSMSQAMARMLRVSGVIPVMFSSAEELLEGRYEGAACLIIDIQLPGLDGFALRDRLASDGTLPPVIFISAFDDADTRAGVERAGVSLFLHKPFSGQALMEAVRRATEAVPH
jgi:FixJ family two-component response regulator